MNSDTLLIIFSFIDGYNKIKIMRTSTKFYKLLFCDNHKLEIEEAVKGKTLEEIKKSALTIFTNAITYGNIITAKWIYCADYLNTPYFDLSQYFLLACSNGHLEAAKWIFKLKNEISDSIWWCAFVISCATSNIDTIVWMCNTFIFSVNDLKKGIKNACLGKRLDVVKMLCDKNSELYTYISSRKNYEMFCQSGKTNIIEWIYLTSINTDIYANINSYVQNYNNFYLACIRGHLKTAQWLYSLNTNIDIHRDNELLFRMVCEEGYLEIVMWLYSLNSQDRIIDIHARNDTAFSNACAWGHLEVAQWLYTLDNKINIYARNNSAYRRAITNNKTNTACWLYSLNPIEFSIAFPQHTMSICH